jgi:hypothetical protein
LSCIRRCSAHRGDGSVACRAAGGGNWSGKGITSSTAASTAGTGVGHALASEILGAGGGTFLGTAVDGSAVLARYTLLGDATLDGMVDFNDLVKLAQNYNTALPSEAVPGAPVGFAGDLARAFASVPEPSIAGVVLVLGVTPRRSRRR